MQAPDDVEVDFLILESATRILEQQGFDVLTGEIPDRRLPWLLAENQYFALGVACANSFEELKTLEAYAKTALVERLKEAGPKKWDAYLVLLAREDEDERGSGAVRRLQHDTSQVRRIVGLGIRPELEAVKRALLPFLPLPDPLDLGLQPAYDSLLSELDLEGVDTQFAQELLHFEPPSGGLEGE